MKFISKILITIVFFSSVYPCLDAEDISIRENIVVSLTTEQAQDEGEDNCSPFCICTCCSITDSIEFQTSLNTSAPSTKSIIQLQDNYFFNPHLSIWQPPKI